MPAEKVPLAWALHAACTCTRTTSTGRAHYAHVPSVPGASRGLRVFPIAHRWAWLSMRPIRVPFVRWARNRLAGLAAPCG